MQYIFVVAISDKSVAGKKPQSSKSTKNNRRPPQWRCVQLMQADSKPQGRTVINFLSSKETDGERTLRGAI